jgi:protein transport protein SEC31
VAQALLTANFEAAVEVCLHNDRMAEAIILALAGGPELLAQTQAKFFQRNKGNLSRVSVTISLSILF